MARQSLVQEGVVCRQQVVHTAILKQHARNEGFDLNGEIFAQLVVERWEQQGIRLNFLKVVDVQPLEREIAYKAGGAGVREHPPRLRFENFRPLQFAVRCDIEQSLIGPLTPEEERKP